MNKIHRGSDVIHKLFKRPLATGFDLEKEVISLESVAFCAFSVPPAGDVAVFSDL